MSSQELKGHRDPDSWQVAMSFVKAVYLATQKFPKDELYGLVSQLRRAAVSIPSNLAEGYGRKSRREFRRFIGNSIGSLLEGETQLEIASDLGFLAPKECSLAVSTVGTLGSAAQRPARLDRAQN